MHFDKPGGPAECRVIGQRPTGEFVVQDGRTGGQYYTKKLLLKRKDAAAALSVTEKTLAQLIASGKVKSFQIGRSWFLSLDAVLEFIHEAESVGLRRDSAERAAVEHVRRKAREGAGRRAYDEVARRDRAGKHKAEGTGQAGQTGES